MVVDAFWRAKVLTGWVIVEVGACGLNKGQPLRVNPGRCGPIKSQRLAAFRAK